MQILSKIFRAVKARWSKFQLIQKVLLLSFFGLLVAGVILALAVGSRPEIVAVFTKPITDVNLLNSISVKLDEENITHSIDANGKVTTSSKTLARRARNVLVRENLLPSDIDPWDLFDETRWTQTDFERNVNLQRTITKQIVKHIEAIDDIDNAQVTLVLPKDTLFAQDRNPVTGSVVLNVKPGSDFRENRKKVEGVERLILLAIEGLAQENLVISDSSGIRLNDFVNLADFDNLEKTKKELKIIAEVEKEYRKSILSALSDIYTPDRVRILNIDVDINFNKKTQKTTENFPIQVKKDNLATPFDEGEVVLSIPRSEKKTLQKYQGTGFNPEGPPGVEGQVPPSYKDLDGIVGDWDSRNTIVNNEINQTITNEEQQYKTRRITASIALDGTWEKNYDEKDNLIWEIGTTVISRTYFEISSRDLQKALSLVQSAVSYSIDRGDSVSVENVQFDRRAQFLAEDAAYLRGKRIRQVLTLIPLAIVALIILLIIIRFIVRLVEEYRIRKEERLAEQYRRMREQQISSMATDDEGVTPESDLDRLTREVADIIKQKPAEIAHLVRVWINS